MGLYENHKKICDIIKEIKFDTFYKIPAVHWSCTGYFGPPLSIDVPSLCIDGIRIKRKYGPLACSQIAVGTTDGQFVFLTDQIATAHSTQVQAPEEIFDAKNIIVQHHNPFINCITIGDGSEIEVLIKNNIKINNIFYYSVSHPCVSSSTEDAIFYVRTGGEWVEVLNREDHSLYKEYFLNQFSKLGSLVKSLSINIARTYEFSDLRAASFRLMSNLIEVRNSYALNEKNIYDIRESFVKYLELLSDETKIDFSSSLNDTTPHHIIRVGHWITGVWIKKDNNKPNNIVSISITDLCGREIYNLGKEILSENLDGTYIFSTPIKCESIKITYSAGRELYRGLDISLDVNISNNWVCVLDNIGCIDGIRNIGNLINDIMSNFRTESCKYFIRGLALKSDPDSFVIAYNYVRNICDTIDENNLQSFIEEQENEINWSIFNDRYIYGRHGFHLPFLNRNKKESIGIIEKCISILSNMDISCGLLYGTLLGAYRKNKFIAHDDDIDMGYITSQSKLYDKIKDIKNELNNNGLVASSYDGIEDIICITDPQHADPIVLELFPIIRDLSDGSDMLHMERMEMRSINSEIIGTFSNHVNLEGHSFPAPDQIEEFLRERYGVDWMKEKRFFEM